MAKSVLFAIISWMNLLPDSPKALQVLLQDAIEGDSTTARRTALLKILLQERYLSRQQLIVRVEGLLGTGCSVTDAAVHAVAYRIRQRNPELSPTEASYLALQGRKPPEN